MEQLFVRLGEFRGILRLHGRSALAERAASRARGTRTPTLLPLDTLDFVMKIRDDRLRCERPELDDGQPAFGDREETVNAHLVEHIADPRFGDTAQHAVARHLIEAAIEQILGLGTTQDRHDLAHAVALPQIVDAPADRPRGIRNVECLEIAFAVRAVPAFCGRALRLSRTVGRNQVCRPLLGFGVGEIPDHIVMQAVRGAAVANHPIQQATFRGTDDLLLLRVEALVVTVQVKQTPAGDDIAVIPQERAPTGFAVTPGATGLLIVCFDAFGHIVVNHITHVGFVDAHTERVRGHDDRHAVVDEIPLSA